MAAKGFARRVSGPILAGVVGLALCAAMATGVSELNPVRRHTRDPATKTTQHWIATLIEHWRDLLAALPRLPEHTDEAGIATPPPIDRAAALGRDITGLREAVAFYKAGDLSRGDAAAKTARDALVHTLLEWAALRSAPHEAGFERLAAFQKAHPDWPTADWLRHRMEAELYFSKATPARVAAFFATEGPQTILGKLVLARTLEAEGKTGEASALVRAIWRESDLTLGLETKIKSDFGVYLDKADYKARADRLLAKSDNGGALRAAALAGKDMVSLLRLRIAAASDRANDKMLSAIPIGLQSDPDYLLAKAQKLRHAEKLKEAAAIMATAPHGSAVAASGDDWWAERRLLARKFLDLGDSETAYRLCAEHDAASFEARLDAHFFTGWLALRFLNDPARAARHFAALAEMAETPISTARAAYWQGRTADISSDPQAYARAKRFYEKAAAETATYYGQLARERLGWPRRVSLRKLTNPVHGDERIEAIRTVELLFAIGENDYAISLASEIAQHVQDDGQLAALVETVALERDARAALTVGKILNLRRLADDSLAFPTFGIPRYDPVDNSAASAIVYSVARQESAFDPRAASSAGAKGLMQMINETAKRTAERAGLDFSTDKLTSDAAFNAKLGAAHLGQLLNEQRGSYILTFAAYNAGGGRVKQWIDAYGDPRSPGVDPIDWVERIPFTETRNYVQRVMENLAMYQVSFSDPPPPARGLGPNDNQMRTATK
jgi:soluble lytic murein transglycosylase